jgi:hypothetical protein
VKMKLKITHLGTDYHKITSQEFPCVYLNKDFYRLFTYEGDKPWSYDSVVEKSVPSYPNPGLYFKPTEYWASFVDSTGMGLTLYTTTHFPNFAAWLFPLPPSETNYLNRLAFFDIPPSGVVEVTAYLIASYYQDARNVVYSIHSNENPMLSWEFNIDKDREGWIPWNDLSALEVSDGMLKTSATGSDPYMVNWAALELDATKCYDIELRMKVSSGNMASIYFTTLTDNEWNEAKVKYFAINAGNNFVTYSIDMRTVAAWQGTISQIRFDPTNEQADSVQIDYLRIISSNGINEEGEENAKPVGFVLYQNHPNPFNSETTIRYMLLHNCFVKLTIYNILGEKVTALISETQCPGGKVVRWDGRDENGNGMSSGIYFYRLQTREFAETKKMLLLK